MDQVGLVGPGSFDLSDFPPGYGPELIQHYPLHISFPGLGSHVLLMNDAVLYDEFPRHALLI